MALAISMGAACSATPIAAQPPPVSSPAPADKSYVNKDGAHTVLVNTAAVRARITTAWLNGIKRLLTFRPRAASALAEPPPGEETGSFNHFHPRSRLNVWAHERRPRPILSADGVAEARLTSGGTDNNHLPRPQLLRVFVDESWAWW